MKEQAENDTAEGVGQPEEGLNPSKEGTIPEFSFWMSTLEGLRDSH